MERDEIKLFEAMELKCGLEGIYCDEVGNFKKKITKHPPQTALLLCGGLFCKTPFLTANLAVMRYLQKKKKKLAIATGMP